MIDLRKFLSKDRTAQLEERELDRQVPINERKRRRIAAADRARRQRKGQRAYYREQMRVDRLNDVRLGQVRVLYAGPFGNNEARWKNVQNSLLAQGFTEQQLDESVQAYREALDAEVEKLLSA